MNRGWITSSPLYADYMAAIVTGLAVILFGICGCMSLGEIQMRRMAVKFGIAGAVVGIIATTIFFYAYKGFSQAPDPERITPLFSNGIIIYLAVYILTGLLSVALHFAMAKATKQDKYEMQAKYKLFLMILPFTALILVFSYLPLWGWRYAFFDFKPGRELTSEYFVGFKWFTWLFQNPATRADILRVLANTFAMSGLGILFSWLPMAFAIFLSEAQSSKFKRVVQTFTTIPNFISWVLVYSVAFSLLSTEGFVNSMLISLGFIDKGTNFLMSGSFMWLKMWAWGTWKGLGWSAIIYIAAISGIDQEQYEAAIVDGAGRFQKMWHITLPGLMSTFCVLLLISVASILSNGMDQYYVFENAMNKSTIEVLDLYVFHLGLGSGGNSNIPLATVVGMCKTIISVVLLFIANKASSALRGESIV
jgi:putative aldouronate transport system permease protein